MPVTCVCMQHAGIHKVYILHLAEVANMMHDHRL